VRIVIVDIHAIYRSGLAALLQQLPEVEEIAEASTAHEAWQLPLLRDCDVVIVDHDFDTSAQFIRSVCEATRAAVVVCSGLCDEDEVLGAVQAGATGILDKATLDPGALTACVRAAASGAGVMAPQLLGSLLRSLRRVSREVLEPRGVSLARLNTREQEVLRLVAQGMATREVAKQLCYSERTIKNVLHDVATKLNVRTRSQAVALAVRDGLI
jgi:DNA-binding NarL/FixJ family response regulator